LLVSIYRSPGHANSAKDIALIVPQNNPAAKTD
jgi:hypothetical protein